LSGRGGESIEEMALRVITWNMGYATPASYKSHVDEGWQWLLAREPDVAFVQEAHVPDWARARRPILYEPSYPTSAWGSAIVTREELTPKMVLSEDFPWLRYFFGRVVLASVILDGLEVLVGSIHAQAEPQDESRLDKTVLEKTKRRWTTSVWEVDLIFHDLVPFLQGRSFIVGGDLNADPVMDETLSKVGGNRAFFSDLGTAGLLNCSREPQQTFFASGKKPYQLDYLFASADWHDRLSKCAASGYEDFATLSDHVPLIAEFEGR
jgi:endonuclease/exonuclease/phosphatase family metal-dependent hydrolase